MFAMTPSLFPPNLLPELTPCSRPHPQLVEALMSSETAKGQAAGGSRENKAKKGTGGWIIYKCNSPWIIELVVVRKVSVVYTPKCLKAISYRQNISDRHLNRRKSMGTLSKLPRGTQLIHTQSSLFQSRVQTGLMKSHGIENLPKKWLCQILMSLE